MVLIRKPAIFLLVLVVDQIRKTKLDKPTSQRDENRRQLELLTALRRVFDVPTSATNKLQQKFIEGRFCRLPLAEEVHVLFCGVEARLQIA